MRLGRNPATVRWRDFSPAPVTACVVTHLPEQLGYHAGRFDVIRLSLRSLAAHTPRDRYELMVLDNGSCPEVVAYLRSLQDQGVIDYLVLLRRNVGKLAACDILFNAAPGEVIAYADDDVFFEAGWLEATLAVLHGYPRVGMVSARPVRKQFIYGNEYLPGYLQAHPDVSASYGHFIPDDWELEFLRSTGNSRRGLDEVKASRTDILLEHRGLKAYSTAAHFQFAGFRSVLLEGLAHDAGQPWASDDRQLEAAIDQLGYARLSTHGRHVRHIGNVVDPALLAEAGPLAADDIERWAPPTGHRRWRFRPVRALLRRLHDWSYSRMHLPPS